MKNKFLLLAAMLFTAMTLTGCEPGGENPGPDDTKFDRADIVGAWYMTNARYVNNDDGTEDNEDVDYVPFLFNEDGSTTFGGGGSAQEDESEGITWSLLDNDRLLILWPGGEKGGDEYLDFHIEELSAGKLVIMFDFNEIDEGDAFMQFTFSKTDNGGNNNGDVRLVDKITFTQSDGDFSGVTFSYDKQNRVVRADAFGDAYPDDEYECLIYSYGDKILTEANEFQEYRDGILVKVIYAVTVNLDDDGNIVSVRSISSKIWADGKLVEDVEADVSTTETVRFTYENGYLKTYTEPYYSDSGYDQYGEFTTNSVTEYFGEDGNLVKTVDTETKKYVGGAHDNEVNTIENTLTYSDKKSPANVSFDLNAYCLHYGYGEFGFLAPLGFHGKSPKNLVSSSSYTTTEEYITYGSTEYNWELDSDGYITKCIETFELEPGFTVTTTVTYKN